MLPHFQMCWLASSSADVIMASTQWVCRAERKRRELSKGKELWKGEEAILSVTRNHLRVCLASSGPLRDCRPPCLLRAWLRQVTLAFSMSAFCSCVYMYVRERIFVYFCVDLAFPKGLPQRPIRSSGLILWVVIYIVIWVSYNIVWISFRWKPCRLGINPWHVKYTSRMPL